MASSEFLKARQTRYGAYLTIYILVILAVLGAANWLANQHNVSTDTTANKRYTLSEQTQKIVKNLKNDVNINYFDKSSNYTRARDLLDRYKNLSTKLHVNYIDPDKQPDKARAAGIRTYGAVVVENGLRKQEAKSVTEEEITGALIRSLKSGDRLACFVTGSGELSIDETSRGGIGSFKAALEKSNVKTQSFSLLEKQEIPKDCSLVIVAGPKRDYVEAAVNALKTYIDAGGHAMFLLDPPLDFSKGDAVSGSPTLAKMLDGYGVTLDNDLVLDLSGASQLFGLNELSVIVAKYGSHPIVRDLTNTATLFPLSRSLQVKGSAEKLFETSTNSVATENMKPPIEPAKAEKKGPFILGAAGTTPGKGRFVVIGTSNCITNQVFGISQIGNRDLILNAVNWLTADEDLISIRPKDPEDRRLTLNRRQMGTLFYLSVVLLPLIVIVSGFAVWWRRR